MWRVGWLYRISIHAPAWGATCHRWRSLPRPNDFNPRSRMGSDHQVVPLILERDISIHAPAWGATRSQTPSRPTRCYFNPRSRMGSDVLDLRDIHLQGISIHAPAWGATRGGRRPGLEGEISIHAPAWGATDATGMHFSMSEFQSTLPHGERPFIIHPPCDHTEFQSTLPHGERPITQRISAFSRQISIHAPAWGATARAWLIPRSVPFQSTLPHGERHRRQVRI